jgi:hypothetical protein
MKAWLIVITMLGALALPVATANAADPIVVNQSARFVRALNGMLVFERKPHGKWLCMRSVAGKVSVAHGVPAPGCEGRMAVDSKGRVVMTFVREQVKHGKLLSARWYAYDVKRDRVRRLTLPGGRCPLDPFAIWGKRIAYAVNCSTKARNGLWVKDGKKTQRILATSQSVLSLALRGGTLAGELNSFAQDYQRYLLMVGGKRCVHAIAGSTGNLETEDLAGLWIANGNIVWSTGYFVGDPAGPSTGSPTRGFLTSKVPSHCAPPGPNGRYGFDPESSYLTSFDLDGRQLYYSGYDGIRRHTFPPQPTYLPAG